MAWYRGEKFDGEMEKILFRLSDIAVEMDASIKVVVGSRDEKGDLIPPDLTIDSTYGHYIVVNKDEV